jgi:hypothetical protein
VPFHINERLYVKPPALKTAELFSRAVALVRTPPAVVLSDWVPPGAPGGTAASNDRVPSKPPLWPAALWSVIVVPVPFHDAGKSYSNTGVVRACTSEAASPNTAATADMGMNVFIICFFITIASLNCSCSDVSVARGTEAIKKGRWLQQKNWEMSAGVQNETCWGNKMRLA